MKLIEETWKTGTAYEVLLVADKAPAALPASGKDVDGMNDAHTFAPMSVCMWWTRRQRISSTWPTSPAGSWDNKARKRSV